MKEILNFLEYKRNVEKEKSMVERERDILTENVQNESNSKYLKNRNYFHQQRNEFNKVNVAFV